MLRTLGRGLFRRGGVLDVHSRAVATDATERSSGEVPTRFRSIAPSVASDIQRAFAGFEKYRYKSAQLDKPTHCTEDDRRFRFVSLHYIGIIMVCIFLGRKAIRIVFEFKSMPRDVRAAGSTEIDVSKIDIGKTGIYTFRGKVLFVRNRTPEQVERERQVKMEELRDKQRDQDRVKQAEWLVVIGVCTHLGCVPTADKGKYDGFFCTCHGSHYDASGRVREGPAPRNLDVPQYHFDEDGKIVVDGDAVAV